MNKYVNNINKKQQSCCILHIPKGMALRKAQCHDNRAPGLRLRDTIHVPGISGTRLRDTKIVPCPLTVSLKSRDTHFLKFVSLNLAQGHDPGTRHDRVTDKSMPGPG